MGWMDWNQCKKKEQALLLFFELQSPKIQDELPSLLLFPKNDKRLEQSSWICSASIDAGLF